MKLLKFLFILLLSLPVTIYAQSGPPAPGTGIYALIDTQYTVGSYTLGQTKARLTLKNTTSTKYTAVQFRVFYDKVAFSAASVALVGSTTNLSLQSVDSNAYGFMTVTLVYTGSSSTYSLADGQTFEITFTHVSPTTFYGLSGIDSLRWTGSYTFAHPASSQSGLDTVLNLYSYGGYFYRPHLAYHGRFINVTGSGAKNLTLALQKKVKTSSTWSNHATYVTDTSGRFAFNEIVDTSYYDVRLAVQGDTMNVGNVVTTADAALINQWVLGTANPQRFDFYTADVNGSYGISITDAYGVYGRIAGRFTSWPNSVKDILFFTPSQYSTITTNPNTNYTSSITPVTNFTYTILPGQPDSVIYYVCIPGDANGTGYHMARMTPVEVTLNPPVGTPAQVENVIDMQVDYDFPTTNMEVNMPSLKVDENDEVNIPVTIKTNGESISALQLGMKYNSNLLQFIGLENSDKSMFWMSYLNPMDSVIEWGGYDPSAGKNYLIPNEYKIFSLKFKALRPQSDWGQSPLYTTKKFSGNNIYGDMSIKSTNGIMVVYKMSSGNGVSQSGYLVAYPNPTTGEVKFTFDVKEFGNVKLYITDMSGQIKHLIVDETMQPGRYTYIDNLLSLSSGIYTASFQDKKITSVKVIKN
jgi:Secretion system C-terminal sorting domain/Cohesin domain